MAESTFKSGSPTPPTKGTKGPGGFFTKVVFGMPMWAWLSILAGAVILALYLRSRNAEADAGLDEESADWEQVTEDNTAGGVYDEGVAYDQTDGYPGSDGFEDFIEDEESVDEEPAGPEIIVNLDQRSPGSGGGKTARERCGDKPSASPGKGMVWQCHQGRWRRIKRQGQNQKPPSKTPAQKGKAKTKQSQRKGATSQRTIGGGPPNVTAARTKPKSPVQQAKQQASPKRVAPAKKTVAPAKKKKK